MRWYGRISCDTAWDRSARRLLQRLIETPLRSALADSNGLVWIRPITQAITFRGSDGYWELTNSVVNPKDIKWLDSPPRVDSLSCSLEAAEIPIVRLTGYRHNGKPIVETCFIPDGVFRFAEVEQSLWNQFGFGTRTTRADSLFLLASSERPAPNIGNAMSVGLYHHYSTFHCDNPGCSGYQKPVLVPTPANIGTGNQAGAVAYPCPRCGGGWYDRWVLTKQGPASAKQLASGHIVHYPVKPTERRRTPTIGPLSTVVQMQCDQSMWGWQPRQVTRLSSNIKRFLRKQSPEYLISAIRENPEESGDLLRSFLKPNNLQALIELFRQLPAAERMADIPRAIGNAFCPGRPSAYQLNQGGIQVSHHFYIAYCPELFMRQLHFLGVIDCAGAFLDVGSGIGEKPFIAYACGRFSRCHGLEYDARTLAVSDFLLNQLQTTFRYPISFELGDAFTYERYADFDVIYMYRPLRDSARMRELFLKIGADMKIGATCFDIFEKNLAMRRIGVEQYALISGADSNGMASWGTVMPLAEAIEALFP